MQSRDQDNQVPNGIQQQRVSVTTLINFNLLHLSSDTITTSFYYDTMKLPYTAVLTLFLNSVVSAKKTGAGDDHMIRNLLAKVEAQDAKIDVYDAKIAKIEALHDANIAVYDAKIEELNEKNAKLEALLLGAPRVPQGTKNLRRRGLREDDATVDFDATLADAATIKMEEKADDMIALLGVASVLKTLIIEMDPVFNCLKYDNDSQTCTLGSDDTNKVDIIAEDNIDVRAVEGGNIEIAAGGFLKLESDDGDISLQAGGSSDDGSDILIRAANDIDLTAGVVGPSASNIGGDVAISATAGSQGGGVVVTTDDTNGNGKFSVDGVDVPQ